jgi:hypothetical protein
MKQARAWTALLFVWASSVGLFAISCGDDTSGSRPDAATESTMMEDAPASDRAPVPETGSQPSDAACPEVGCAEAGHPDSEAGQQDADGGPDADHYDGDAGHEDADAGHEAGDADAEGGDGGHDAAGG